MDAQAIITAVQQQGGTDASRSTVLSILNEVYGEQVATSRWLRAEVDLGSTVAGQAVYSFPASIVELYQVKAGGFPYDPIGEDSMWRLQASQIVYRSGRGGLFSPTFDATGSPSFTLYPTPDTGGAAIVGLAAIVPADLTDSNSSVPVTPVDAHSSLIDGTLARVLMRVDERPDLAGTFEQRYQGSIEALRRRKNSLMGGRGPVQVQVAGIHY